MIDVWNRVMTNISIACGSSVAKVTSTTNDTPSEFPAVAVEQIDNRDYAVDLENSENGVMTVMQIQVFSNKSLTEARSIMNTICDAMRQMGYRRFSGPEPIPNMSNIKIIRTVARFRRFVGDLSEIPRFPNPDP